MKLSSILTTDYAKYDAGANLVFHSESLDYRYGEIKAVLAELQREHFFESHGVEEEH